MATCFQSLDFFGQEARLHLFGNKTYKTLVGTILGLFAIISILVISGYFIIKLYMRSEVKIISNQNMSQIYSINLSNMPLILGLGVASSIFNDDRLFSFGIYVLSSKYNENQDGIVEQLTSIPYEKCNVSKHFTNYTQYLKGQLESKFSYCVDTSNITLIGKFGDITKGYSILNIYVNKCVNNTKKNDCYDKSFIDKMLQEVYLDVNFLDYEINHFNTTSPIKIIKDERVLGISNTLYKKYIFFINKIHYNTDFGFVFEDNKKLELYQHDFKYSADSDFRTGTVESPDAIGHISFQCSGIIYTYNRSFAKFQFVFANIGGMFNFIWTLATWLNFILIRRFLL